jgi:hypothetical protein
VDDIVEQQIPIHVHKAAIVPQHRRQPDLADRARNHVRCRLHVVEDQRAILGAVAKQQFIGVQGAVAIEDRLATEEDAFRLAMAARAGAGMGGVTRIAFNARHGTNYRTA